MNLDVILRGPKAEHDALRSLPSEVESRHPIGFHTVPGHLQDQALRVVILKNGSNLSGGFIPECRLGVQPRASATPENV